MQIIQFVIALSLAIAAVPNTSGNEMVVTNAQKSAQQFVASFRQGEAFNPNDDISPLIRGGQIDNAALSFLSKELREGSTEVRKSIVQLLTKAALELDTPPASKIPVIRDRSIIKILVTDAFAKDDTASNLAELTLRQECRPADLAQFNDVYKESVRTGRGNYLLIIAKAKAADATQYVQTIADSPDWRKHPERLKTVQIAQAALGNNEIEDHFINAVYEAERSAPPAPKNRFYDVGSAKDGGEVADRLQVLGWIGTNRSLAVACNFLRSPLKRYVPNARERSVRLSAVDAIRYNYPDERILVRPISLEDWQAIEIFCKQNIGVAFEGPTPDLPPDRAYPAR